jgi:hypothetical protein
MNYTLEAFFWIIIMQTGPGKPCVQMALDVRQNLYIVSIILKEI